MFYPISLSNSSPDCGPCTGMPVRIATLTTILEMNGVDYREWDDNDYNLPYRAADDPHAAHPDHKERRFFEWSRAHGLTDDTVFTLLSNNIKRIATLRNTPLDFLDTMELSKGQKLIIRSLMMEDWSCSFCGTYHNSPKNSCSIISPRPQHGDGGGGSLKCKSEKQMKLLEKSTTLTNMYTKSKIAVTRCNSLPGDELCESDPEQQQDPLSSYMSRGRRNTTGENYGYLHCHPKYWADILPVPTKLIKML